MSENNGKKASQSPLPSVGSEVQGKSADPKAQVSPKCGLVMPISAWEGCSELHWAEVKSIIIEALEGSGFDVELVSTGADVGVIQNRIVENLYNNPIVVCDVSGKNPNVMFELGLRLAFDKPTIVIKDDKTSYSFDTSPIEHLVYPRDLHYPSMKIFKAELAKKVTETHKRASSDPNYTTFLKHFGTFRVAKLETKEVSEAEFVRQELTDLKHMMMEMRMRTDAGARIHPLFTPDQTAFLDHVIEEYCQGRGIDVQNATSTPVIEVLADTMTSAFRKNGYRFSSREIRERLREIARRNTQN